MSTDRLNCALEIGLRLLGDADKLRLFLNDEFQAVFPIEWCGRSYTVTLKPMEQTNDAD